MRHWMVAGVLVFGALGCSHESAATRGESGYEQAKGDFAAAYDSVKNGARQTATAGKLAFKGAGRGAVQVTDQTKEAFGKAGSKTEDAWITTKVKTELATTKGVKSTAVHVDTDGGIVKLSGTVDGPEAAERAIQTALDVKGVSAVDSRLAYPTQKMAPRVYTKQKETSY